MYRGIDAKEPLFPGIAKRQFFSSIGQNSCSESFSTMEISNKEDLHGISNILFNLKNFLPIKTTIIFFLMSNIIYYYNVAIV